MFMTRNNFKIKLLLKVIKFTQIKHFTFFKHSFTKQSTLFTRWNWDWMPRVICDRPTLNRGCTRAIINTWHCFQHHTACNKYTIFCTKEWSAVALHDSVLWNEKWNPQALYLYIPWTWIQNWNSPKVIWEITLKQTTSNRYQWYIKHYNCPTIFM